MLVPTRMEYIYAHVEVHDIMKLNLGNLKPNKSVTLNLIYLEPLKVTMNKFWRLIIFNILVSDPLYLRFTQSGVAPFLSLPSLGKIKK